MTPKTILAPRFVKDYGMPNKAKEYHTDKGIYLFSTDYNCWLNKYGEEIEVKYWLEEIELPDEDQINNQYPIQDKDLFSSKNINSFNRRIGAKHILNLIFKK